MHEEGRFLFRGRPENIRIPTGDNLKAVIEGFKEKLGFPQCVGVVDGTHIPIVSPVECPADYYNRKGWHSIIMQYVRQVAIATRSNSGFCACFCYTPSGKKTWGQP